MDNIKILERVKQLLKIYDTDIYDAELNMYIDDAILSLDIEGVKKSDINKLDETYQSKYIVAISYKCALNLDMDLDAKKIGQLYISSVNKLRLKLRLINEEQN